MEKRIQKLKLKKGAFTRYCGGKVTEECIRRGENSPDPTIRRRARLARIFRKISNMRKKK